MTKRYEGLDWISVDTILEVAPERYAELLAETLKKLEGYDPTSADAITDEAKRRLETDEMPEEQGLLFWEAVQIVSADTKKLIDDIKKVITRGRFRVVK